MKRLLLVVVLLMTWTVPAWAAEVRFPQVEELYQEAETTGVTPGTDLEEGISEVLSEAWGKIGELGREVLGTGARLLAVVLFCSLAESAGLPGNQEGLQAVELAGALAITALTMTDMESMIGLGRETIQRMDRFSGVLLPAMAVLTAATGGIRAAALRQGATVLFSGALLSAMDRLLIPLLYAHVALHCAHAAVGNPGLAKLAEILKSVVTFLLTALLLGYVGYLTASGAIAGSVDASSVKAAKLAITRMIPVVGGILADASETVLAGAGVLRGTVGAAGLTAVLAICVTPFLRLGLHYLVYRAVAALCATLARSRLSGLIDAIGGVFGLVLGMTGAAALLLLVSVVSAVKAVVP